MMPRKFNALKKMSLCMLVSVGLSAASAFAQPTSSHYLFKYTNIGVRDLGSLTYMPYAAQAVQGLGNKFNFVAANGIGTEPPYYNDSTQTGDVAFLEGDWGILFGVEYAWVGHTEVFNQINGNYVTCFDSSGQPAFDNCNTTNKKALFALIRFNNYYLNDL